MYGLPETHLFSEETMSARAARAAAATYPMGDGLVRAVAELYFGAQDERAVGTAREWLRMRAGATTADVFRMLARQVSPRIVLDKSPSTINSGAVLMRLRRNFPRARFIHLCRHPLGHGESVLRYIEERKRHGPIPPTHWLLQISSEEPEGGKERPASGDRALDPQGGWYRRHKIIWNFLQSVPADMQYRLRGEDLLANPEAVLPGIARWVGVRDDADAIDEMKHPERSPYAFLGPPGARYGNDAFFLRDPALRVQRASEKSLDEPVSWLPDRQGLREEVKVLARDMGYQ
jgi:hypothetical protein